MTIQLHSSFAVHPGLWLRAEVVEPAGLSVSDAANRLAVSRQSMSKLLNGRQGLSAEMAIRFEKAFRLKAETLMRREAALELQWCGMSGRNAVRWVTFRIIKGASTADSLSSDLSEARTRRWHLKTPIGIEADLISQILP